MLRRSPVARSQMWTVSSAEPAATSLLSGENATERTDPECPVRVMRGWPVSACQIVTVLSSEAVAAQEPSAEKATALTGLLCPLNVAAAGLRVPASQVKTEWSA